MISYSVYFTWQIYMCMPRNITLPLEKTEGAIRNGHFRDTDNIRHTRDRKNNDRHYITQKTPYNPDDNSSDTKEKTVLDLLAVPVVSLLNNTNIIC
jgi:hypothetical protein